MSEPRLDRRLIAVLRGDLRAVADHTVTAVRQEVPSYAGALSGRMGDNIKAAVLMALAGFLRLAERGIDIDPGTPLSPALEGAYALGRGEARSGRSADALLAAYRVGARVAWRELADAAVAHDASPGDLAAFAEMVFAYIDGLSAASLAGHADELATTGRVRERYLDRLGRNLLSGAPADHVRAAAERADWKPPQTLTAVLIPESQARPAHTTVELAGLGTPLVLAGDLPGVGDPNADAGTNSGTGAGSTAAADAIAAMLVPDAHGKSRGRLVAGLAGRTAVIGPARDWLDVRASYDRAVRARRLLPASAEPVDTDEHLVALVLTADPAALADLRERALAPLDDCRPATREKLIETLRAWLLHQGRRDDVATALFVHPQTVRYRMGQIRDLYGDALDDPDAVLAITLAVADPAEVNAQNTLTWPK